MYKLKNWATLEMDAEYIGVTIDPNNPRDSRLKVAMKYHELGHPLEAVLAMTGETPTDLDAMMILANFGVNQTNPKTFYEGYTSVDELVE